MFIRFAVALIASTVSVIGSAYGDPQSDRDTSTMLNRFSSRAARPQVPTDCTYKFRSHDFRTKGGHTTTPFHHVRLRLAIADGWGGFCTNIIDKAISEYCVLVTIPKQQPIRRKVVTWQKYCLIEFDTVSDVRCALSALACGLEVKGLVPLTCQMSTVSFPPLYSPNNS